MLSALPSPPSRSDSANFASRADVWNAALVTLRAEINAMGLENLQQGTQATAARDAAIAAWAASTAPMEALAAVRRDMHYGNIIKAIIYDTSKDSDGGAWRKRCADKSWFTEALGFTGVWGGQAASNAAGWAACGAVVGGAYQSTADGKFYAPTSGSAQTEIYRGNVREFPEQVAIVLDPPRVVIYDLTQVGCPVWMVFVSNLGGYGRSGYPSAVAAVNGTLAIGYADALVEVRFASDRGARTHNGATNYYLEGIAGRNAAVTIGPRYLSAGIVNAQVNDVAMTVLEAALIDPATGLPVPTIAVATAGGVSVIKDSGVVYNITGQSSGVLRVFFTQDKRIVCNGAYANEIGVYPIPTASILYSANSGYYLNSGIAGGSNNVKLIGGTSSSFTNIGRVNAGFAIGSNNLGVSLVKENPASATLGMVSYITNTYTTGWMPGDIRGAHLADTTAETITGSGELVTNGTFTTDVSGWTFSGTGVWIAGALLDATSSAGSNVIAQQSIATVAGGNYVICYATATGSGTVGVKVQGSTLSGGSGVFGIGERLFSFAAQGSSVTLQFYGPAGASRAVLDNVSVKLADPDRSVKNTGLMLYGTLTKTAVASGAGLVYYTGFSAANYLDQPHNPNLDFGTGDFCVMGWANLFTLSTGVMVQRGGVVGGSGLFGVYIISGQYAFACSATGSTNIMTGVTASLGLHHVALVRQSGVAYYWVDGVLIYSVANTENVTNTNANLVIGNNPTQDAPAQGALALWRIAATAPSADQIAHIYRTELPLFQANTQCTIAGASTSVSALAYDDATDTLHVGTSWGRTAFCDLVRVESEATTTGALMSISASQGAVLTGWASSGRYYQPAMLLRDELRRKDVARVALGKVPVFFDYTAIAGQTAFVVPKGYTAKAFYKNGTLMREATTGTYWSRSNDGFKETATLSVGASVSDWVSIMATRNY